MKNILIILVVFVSVYGFGQDQASVFNRKHEIKVGAIRLLAGPILEGTYEYIYSKDFTYGTSVLVNLNSKNYYDEEFSITPFARFYFQETKEYGAQGFFVEGFGKYVSGKYNPTLIFNTDPPKSYSAAALGIGLGKKWFNSSGFVFEVLVGVGRTIGGGEQPDAIFRGDIGLGYRF